MAKRKRRAFTTEFKAEAVRLVRESGKSVPTVARELDLTETALVEQLLTHLGLPSERVRADPAHPPPAILFADTPA